MRRFVILVVATVAVLSALLAGCGGGSGGDGGDGGNGGTPPSSCSIAVESTPSGAKIYLQGGNTGYTTPHTFTGRTPGTYTVRLTLNGYQDYQLSNYVPGGKKWTIRATLQPQRQVWSRKWYNISATLQSIAANDNGDVIVVGEGYIGTFGNGGETSTGNWRYTNWEFRDVAMGVGRAFIVGRDKANSRAFVRAFSNGNWTNYDIPIDAWALTVTAGYCPISNDHLLTVAASNGSIYQRQTCDDRWALKHTMPARATAWDGALYGMPNQWVVGDDGALAFTLGSDWQRRYAGDKTLYGVFFNNDRDGWAVGQSGRIICTQDGGYTWHSQQSGTGRTMCAVQFVNDTNGWACGYAGTILFTTDGGSTWTSAVTSPSTDGLVRRMTWTLTSGHCYILAIVHDTPNESPSSIYRYRLY